MFLGREDELQGLSDLWKKSTASLVTCRGRRRIGKSTLIEEFAARSKVRFIEIAGEAPRPGMTNAADSGAGPRNASLLGRSSTSVE